MGEKYEPNRYEDEVQINNGLKCFKNKEIVSLNQRINIGKDKNRKCSVHIIPKLKIMLEIILLVFIK